MKGRIIYSGSAKGEALVSPAPVSFYGGIDPETGRIIERGHPLEGQSVSGKILVFPFGKGSTVGSYIIYRLKKSLKAPAGIINQECEPIVAVGAIISSIPLIDRVDIKKIKTGDIVEMNGEEVTIK